MPGNADDPGSAVKWLDRAKGDLALAAAPLPIGAYYEDLCYHCQQAAEKALKAVYLHQGWKFRFVHDLEELITGLRQNGLTLPDDVAATAVLTAYASQARYPGLDEPIIEEEYRQAFDQAARVVRWAEGQILKRCGG